MRSELHYVHLGSTYFWMGILTFSYRVKPWLQSQAAQSVISKGQWQLPIAPAGANLGDLSQDHQVYRAMWKFIFSAPLE